MPLIQRPRPRTRSPSPAPSGSRPPKGAPNETDSGRSLSQTRLDRIASPTATYHRSFHRWLFRLLAAPSTYTPAAMKEYLQEDLGPIISELRILTACPGGLLTGDEWEALEDELRRLEGKADALTLVLEMREAQVRAGVPRERQRLMRLGTRRGSESPSPATTSPASDDPFEGA